MPSVAFGLGGFVRANRGATRATGHGTIQHKVPHEKGKRIHQSGEMDCRQSGDHHLHLGVSCSCTRKQCLGKI